MGRPSLWTGQGGVVLPGPVFALFLGVALVIYFNVVVVAALHDKNQVVSTAPRILIERASFCVERAIQIVHHRFVNASVSGAVMTPELVRVVDVPENVKPFVSRCFDAINVGGWQFPELVDREMRH